MADNTTLWAAVVASYSTEGLATLTNIHDTGSTAITTAVGEDAAQGVIDLWPIFAQEDFDVTDAAHLEVAKRGVISLLYQRGGSSNQIAKIEWDEVFGDTGLISKIRKTGPRARIIPQSNSNLQSTNDQANAYGWSDHASFPARGLLPRSIAEVPDWW